jgi:DNA-binding helix-hairpin-helix protein with protein kinase domain
MAAALLPLPCSICARAIRPPMSSGAQAIAALRAASAPSVSPLALRKAVREKWRSAACGSRLTVWSKSPSALALSPVDFSIAARPRYGVGLIVPISMAWWKSASAQLASFLTQ